MHVTWVLLAILAILAALPLGILPQIPESAGIAAIAGFAVLLGFMRIALLRVIGIGLLLLAWSLSEARNIINTIEQLSAKPVEATVRVTEVREDKKQLTAQIIRVGERYQFPPLFITLNNVDAATPFCAGQRWDMTLRLRPVHARLNEGAFDLQRFMIAKHMPLQGRIVSKQALSTQCSWRTRFINHHLPALEGRQQPAILQALAFGMRNSMTEVHRRLLRETGTAHLMAISGLHIALAAGVGWWLARAIQIFFPARWIGYLFPLMTSWGSAAVYCWISGSHAPAQRAIAALTVWMVIRLAGWQLSAWQIWALCIGGLLWLDPLTVLSESFWLSALAVAMLIAWFQWFALPAPYRTQRRWLLLQLLHLQLGMMILMAPLQIFLFQGISISALPANLLAVPVVSFITVPLILLAMLIPVPVLSSGLWWLADLSVNVVVRGLQLLPAGWWTWSEALPAIVFVWGGIVMWRSGLIYRAIIPCCSVILALVLWRNSAQHDDWQIDMLDVGHGLAVAITQGDETVLYDAGPSWRQDDAGARVILPWLHYQGRKLQGVILSHKHLDHRGGLASLLKANPEMTVRSGLAQTNHLLCHRGQRWQWGKLHFTALWPPAEQTQGQNNDSCVVRVDDGQVSLLLTGDIELEAERKLVALEKNALNATLLQVPHHGSRTSSSALLLRSVAGQAAFASVARYNAWRMPAKAVVDRYHQQGYHWHDTAQSGQIHIGIRQGHWQIKGLREQIMPRWYHQWFGVKRDSR